MADISSLVTVLGQNQHTEREFKWHSWEITVPAIALAGAGADDIILEDLFPTGSRLLALTTQVVTAQAAVTSLLMDIEIGLKADVGGAISGLANIAAAIDLETVDTTIEATGNIVWPTFGAAVEGTNKRIIQLELTKTGAVTLEGVYIVSALLGRSDY